MLAPFLVTLKVIRVLEECGMNYLIGSSLGSSFYGIPRATLNADLVSDNVSNSSPAAKTMAPVPPCSRQACSSFSRAMASWYFSLVISVWVLIMIIL